MNLLPKTREEFASSDYWNAFFKKRGDEAFEWYGEYLDLCEYLHKYAKANDKILNIGCGNSKLSMDMYDSGFKEITNIDISPVAIKKMIDMNAAARPNMKFLQMDATAMSFAEDSFTVALDKGTLDALFVDNTDEVRGTVKKYFDEISRVMRTGGRYLCITLLQEHIINYILGYFPHNSFMLRIVNCSKSGQSKQVNQTNGKDAMNFPVFMIVATKFKVLPAPILEFSLDGIKMQRVKYAQGLKDAVSSVQRAALVCNGLTRSKIIGNEVGMDLFEPGNEDARYTVYVLDQPPARNMGKYAAFVVPQGRETEWLFSTPQGRKKLLASAKYQRLAIVTMHRDQDYDSLDCVKAELSNSINSLAPLGTKEGTIPYLSLGDDVGHRETLVTGFSKISGKFRVEEVEGHGGKLFRRLIFLDNQFVVQSEALIKTIKLKGNKEKKKVDVGYLACQHHLYMSIGTQLSTVLQANSNNYALVVGLGGGGLCSFLHDALPLLRITAVEIDPLMLEIAEQYFDLKQDKRLHVTIDDGLNFLQRCAAEDIKFDAVLFDVDSKDLSLGMSCPPQSFLAADVLNNVKSIMGPKGMFILNLVCRDEVLRENAMKPLREMFAAVCSYKLNEDLNEVVFCSMNETYKTVDDWRKAFGTAGRNLIEAIKTQKLYSTPKVPEDDDILDVADFLNELSISN